MQRTDRQNRALHLWLSMLAETLNAAGLDQRTVLKPGVSIPWTPDAAKEQLWRPIQEALVGKHSTTQLEKLEVGEVEEVLTRHLQEKFGVEIPPWPHFESEEAYIEETTTLADSTPTTVDD